MSSATSRELVESKFPSESRQLTWSIADFSKVKMSTDMIKATETRFEMGRSIGCLMTLKAYLEVDTRFFPRNFIGVFFRVLDDNGEDGEAPKNVLVTADIKIGDYTQNQISAKKLGQGCGWPMVFPQLLAELPLDAHGSLPIDITLTLHNIPGHGLTLANLMPKHKSKFLQTFSADMEKMYKAPAHFAPGAPTMITAVSKDGREVPSSSMMLAARSPVFQTMFQTPMKEMKEGVVNIEDIGGDALEVLLHFMHTGVLQDNWKEPEILEELTCAAHRYLMQDLVDFLDEAIGLVCSPQNYLNMARVAHRLEMEKAEKALLKILQDKCNLATNSEEIAKLFQEQIMQGM